MTAVRLQVQARLRRSLSYVPPVIALVIILVAGISVERQNAEIETQELRSKALFRLDILRAGLEREVLSEATALEGLARSLSLFDRLDERRFQRLVAVHFGDGDTPDAVVSLLPDGRLLASAPEDGLPGIVGEVLATAPADRAGIRMLPSDLGMSLLIWSQGGEAGRVASLIDADALLAAAGLRQGRFGLNLVLTGAIPGTEAAGRALLFGSPDVLQADPARVDVAVPGGRWQLAGIPELGWTEAVGPAWPTRLVTLVSAALIVGPMVVASGLIAERHHHLDTLRHRESELERLSRRLGLALDASLVGVWDYDIDTGALVWDDRMDELYAMPADGRARTYQDWSGRLHPDDRARAEAEFLRALRSGAPYTAEFRLLLPGSTIRHIRAIAATYDDAGGARRMVGINIDMTADIRRNEELEAKRREAEAASVAKTQFLATTSHEIRTPINGVLGMLDLIARDATTPEQRDHAMLAHDSARHLLDILDGILDYARLEARGVTLELQSTDVVEMAETVVALLDAGAGRPEISLTLHCADDVPRWLLVDPVRLRQIMNNLVGNALKYTEEGRIDVFLRHDPSAGGTLEVTVRDTGIGIADEDRKKLFQRFAQIDSSLSRARGGTGLGLAICKELVDLMGGRIELVQPRDGCSDDGSTFLFRIPAPIARPAQAAPRRDIDAEAVPEGRSARVLLAEDNSTNRQILEAYLAMAGHYVRSVATGTDALAALADAPYDLVLMDVQMPEMDGLEAARRIRAGTGPHRTVPIIALTAGVMDGDREACIAAGMTDYVAKPVEANTLLATIARVLGPEPAVETRPRSTGTDA